MPDSSCQGLPEPAGESGSDSRFLNSLRRDRESSSSNRGITLQELEMISNLMEREKEQRERFRFPRQQRRL